MCGALRALLFQTACRIWHGGPGKNNGLFAAISSSLIEKCRMNIQEPYPRNEMGTKRRILIIDDNEHIVAALKVFLDRKYEIFTACNGVEGLAAIEQCENGVDLVITDLVMPELSGAEVISAVKQKYPKTLVIVMTGWGEHPDAMASEAHADRLLVKPFGLESLDGCLTELLS
jgi:DNA-binding NtrC family response regulator